LQDDYIQATSGGASELVTAHELGHMAWDRCGKTEHLSHPQEFYFWVVKLFDAGRAKYQLALQAQL